jgi:hypothetical protein
MEKKKDGKWINERGGSTVRKTKEQIEKTAQN